MQIIYIRCDANETNGYGHLSRCLNLARGIKEKNENFNVTFIGDYSPTAISMIKKWNLNYYIFKEHDANDSMNLLHHMPNLEYLILDSYSITQNYISKLSNLKFKLCLIADESITLNLSNVDMVVNYSINAQNFDYKSKEQALGLKYFPAKPEFKVIRELSFLKKHDATNHILIMMGGHDRYSIGVSVLNIIDSLTVNKNVTYISSLPETDRVTIKNNKLKVLPFYENIEDIYSTVDISITGGGMSKYESCYCNIINACVPQNLNEYNDSLYFEANNLTTILGTAYEYKELDISSKISDLLKSPPCRPSNIFFTDSLDNLVEQILN